jgi:hypothetical protein
MNNVPKHSLNSTRKQDRDRDSDEEDKSFLQSAVVPHFLNSDIRAWSVEDVQTWLRYFELTPLAG